MINKQLEQMLQKVYKSREKKRVCSIALHLHAQFTHHCTEGAAPESSSTTSILFSILYTHHFEPTLKSLYFPMFDTLSNSCLLLKI